MATFSRAYPTTAFWGRLIFKPFIQLFVALFKLTWLVSKWMLLGAFALYSWMLREIVTRLRKKSAPRVA